MDSTAGSCDPLFANQSLEQINLGWQHFQKISQFILYFNDSYSYI